MMLEKRPGFLAGPLSFIFLRNISGRCVVKTHMRKILSPVVLTALAVTSFGFPGTATGSHRGESIRKLVSAEKYSCSQHYEAKVFRRPRGAEDGKHPANQKLKALLERRRDEIVPGPRHGWIRVYRQQGEAEFLREKRSRKSYFSISLEKEGERWKWAGSWSGCRPSAWGPKTEGGTIELRDGHPPKADDTRLRVLVHEWSCHGYRVPKREDVHPRVIYGRDNLIVILRIEYPQGDATCPGTPPFRYTVKLDEPLGDRALVDGGLYPPRVRKEAS